MGRVTRAFDALLGRDRRNEVDITQLLLKNFGIHSKSGATVSIDTALGVMAVFGCLRVLAEGIGQLPLKLMLEDESTDTKTVASKHPAHRVLSRRPNDWQTSFGFRETLMYHAVLTGAAFAFKNVVRGNLRELIPIPPNYVKVKRATDYSLTYEVKDPSNNVIAPALGRDQILHLSGPSWNGYLGMEVMCIARDAIGLSIATEENHSLMHANGSQVGGVLTTDKTLDEAGIARIRGLWDAARGGGNKFSTAVLDNNLQYTRMGMSGVDSEHLATRDHQIQEVCRALRVFPQMIGFTDKTATFASAESFFIAHVVHSLGPWVERWDQTLNTQVLTEAEIAQGYFFKLFTAGLMRGNDQARSEFYKSGILTGWMTRNEARRFEDLDPLPDLDEPLVPLNMNIAGAPPPPDPNAPPGTVPSSMFPNIAIAPKSLVDALRNALMGHNGGPPLDDVRKNVGRVLSGANEKLIRDATGLIGEADGKLNTVLDKLATEPEVPDASAQ